MMSRRQLWPRLTPHRRAWLEQLELGPAVRHSRAGFDCMRLGWSEWHRDAAGAFLRNDAGQCLERITPAGLAALGRPPAVPLIGCGG